VVSSVSPFGLYRKHGTGPLCGCNERINSGTGVTAFVVVVVAGVDEAFVVDEADADEDDADAEDAEAPDAALAAVAAVGTAQI
jgi:hypothetical protein